MEPLVMERLKKRRDFLAAARGAKAVRKAFILQSRRRDDRGNDGREGPGGDPDPARFGFTVTRRTARNAVDRNRIRRRLRQAARLTAPAAGHDLVLIGRRAALSVPFGDLVADLENAIMEITGMAAGGVETGGDARPGGRAMDNADDAPERGRQSGARRAARRKT
jgi:ribonuclease P protein component